MRDAMLELIGLIKAMEIRDGIDILLVAGIFYLTFSMLRGSRSAAAFRGLLTILIGSLAMYFIARFLDLRSMLMLFQVFWVVVVLAFIIVFQHDLRRSLTQIGQLRAFRHLFTHTARHLDEVVRAVNMMSRRRVGALIVFERRNSLRVYAETGTRIEAQVSVELLRTLFTPHTPLHDGAVIVRDEQILAAGCILPLSQDASLGKDLGTRHRAALGLAEETDAIVVVVSEETGIISTVLNGRLSRGMSAEELRDLLVEELDVKPEATIDV